MYCEKCGKELIGGPSFCPYCGAKITGAGTSNGSYGKSKTASILLAVFLSFWTWLYTYKKDAWKFWLGLGLMIVNLILFIVTFGYWVLFGWIISIPVWIWAIVDVAVKNDNWYNTYQFLPEVKSPESQGKKTSNER